MSGDGAEPRGSRNIEADLLESVGTILTTLKAVGEGDLSRHLELNFPESHPVGALGTSINMMMESLGEARMASASYLDRLNEQIAMIGRQREAIRNLSTPVIEVWSGVLCVPIVGLLDSARASDVTTALLNAIVAKKAQHAIVDVTGIEVMDTRSADYFLRMAHAVTLLGARCVLSGVHPNIARTIVHMGVELQGLKSYRTMREALRSCVQQAHRSAQRRRNGARGKDG